MSTYWRVKKKVACSKGLPPRVFLAVGCDSVQQRLVQGRVRGRLLVWLPLHLTCRSGVLLLGQLSVIVTAKRRVPSCVVPTCMPVSTNDVLTWGKLANASGCCYWVHCHW
eukprot:GHUV01012775.1.p1 GENE.GHUV01012775.1~~GHUV01012775.1.p1  ORF type:complete len:110 (+),score=10.62 GHUV01012775.1:358-687(+)